MAFKFKKIMGGLFWALVLAGTTVPGWADPSQNVGPDQDIYKRVKKLEDYGLLDAQDRAVLDQGRVVTRLELAFYVEKAGAVLEKPEWSYKPTLTTAPVTSPQAPLPTVPEQPPAVAPPAVIPVEAPSIPPPVATPTPIPAARVPEEPIAIPPPPEAAPVPEAPAFVPPPVSAPPSVEEAVPSKSDLEKQIADLLSELNQESQVLRTRLAMDDYRIAQQSGKLDQLQSVQDDVNAAFRKANRASGSAHINYETDMRVENFHLSGITMVSATRAVNEMNLVFMSDLGGKGSFSMGLNGTLPYSNYSAGPASIYLSSPNVGFALDGKLGHWSNTVAVEDYTGDTDMGDFTRGSSPGNQRYEDPFDIKKYSGDKNLKNWQDYMTNLGYVPSSVSWISQNSSAKVFDGLYMLGSQLPLVSPDAKMTLLVGRLDQVQRWEEGIKYSQPWGGGFLNTSFSTLWVNDNYGGAPPVGTGVLDLRSYEANLGFDLKPAFLQLDGGFSQFQSGVGAGVDDLIAPGGRASLNFYPFTVYYSAISDGYANFQSKVIVSGINFPQYGFAAATGSNTTAANDQYGFIGMVDDLISDRYGWRANLGWKGRQSDWTAGLPSFLDDMVINFDVAQKTEYRDVADESPSGYSDVEAYNLVSVYYPEDTGLFGGDIWGGFTGAHPAGQIYINNIESQRNDANWNGTATTDNAYVVRFGAGTTERVPLILPVDGTGHPLDAGSQPETGLDGHNLYLNLTQLKTFNYITLTTKWQLNKMLGLTDPLYGAFFFTDNRVSGASADPALSSLPDPNRPGQTLANIPDLFDQRAYDGALMVGVLGNIDLMADYGLEFWKSDYTYPLVDYRTDSLGLGLAYDFPWGGGKWELRYKHLTFTDRYVPANDYQADQIYSYFLLQF